jgi:hypothetical protein
LAARSAIGLFLLFLNLSTNPILGYWRPATGGAVRLGGDAPLLLGGFAVMSLGADQPARHRARPRVQFALVVALVVSCHGGAGVDAGRPGRLTPFAPNGWWAVGAAIVVCLLLLRLGERRTRGRGSATRSAATRGRR